MISLIRPLKPVLRPLPLLALTICAAALAAACGSDPTPIPPTPTATPAPTATPTPADMSEFMIDEHTLGRDIIDVLSDAEASCIRTALGEEGFARLLDSPVVEEGFARLLDSPVVTDGDDFQEFPIDCIDQETAAPLLVALIGAETGGLTAESERCLLALYADGPAAAFFFGSQPGPSSSPEAFAILIETSLCMTDDEAEAFTCNCSELRGNEEIAAFDERIEAPCPPCSKEGCQGHLALRAP